MREETERHHLRATFDEVPELYDRARAPYPDELFDELVALAGLSEGDRLLEIGCGTGLATVPLAARGLEIVGIEIGPRLAALARNKLVGFTNVRVVTAAFESWEPAGEERFDAVGAFTAFHWIDPDVRYEKPARLLRDGGSLVVVSTQNVLPEGDDPFWIDVQEDYDAILPSDENRPPPRPEEVGDMRAELEASDLFGDIAVRRYLWSVPYTADEYIEKLETYSGHRVVEERLRQRLYKRIRRRIKELPGGSVEQPLLATLTIGRRP